MPNQRVKHLDASAPSSTAKTACGIASHALRIVTTLAAFILKGDNYFACWRCRQTAKYTSLGGTPSSY